MQAVAGALERLVSAVRDLSDQWIPIQSHTTDILRQRFDEGRYACSRAHLAHDIRQDPGLYLYCVKELAQRLPSSNHTPLELFFQAPLEWLYEIIQSAPQARSLDSVTQAQASRMKETMVAAVTSELLSPSVHLDPELGYTTSLIRHLGITLAAWNYPDIYEKALKNCGNDCTQLDSTLKEAIGFSPQALGSTMARQWRLCSEIQDALKPSTDTNTAFSNSQRLVRHENPGTKLRKICEISDTIARALQPNRYKDQDKALHHAQTELIRQLGNGALKQVSQTARERLMRYSNYELHMPAVATTEELKRVVAASVHSDELMKQNEYLSKLGETQRQALIAVYKQFTPHEVAREALRTLVKEVIPQFGFSAGYVFLYSPKQNALSATLTIGEPSSYAPKHLSLRLDMNRNNIAFAAYSMKSTLRTELRIPGASVSTAFAGRLGNGQAIGVLYLESNAATLSLSSDVDPITRFKALQSCLAAALHAG